MKLTPESQMITPRVPVIAHLRPLRSAGSRQPLQGNSPEIWPLKAVATMVLAIIALSALCAIIAQQSERATVHVLERIDEVERRMDAEQRLAELLGEKGDPR